MEKLLLIVTVSSGLCAGTSNAERRYHFVYEPKNWTEALSYCREKHTDLATIESMEDVKTLKDMAELSKFGDSGYSYRAWIGLYNDVNSWRWSMSDSDFYKNDEAEFRNWWPHQPDNEGANEHCVAIHDSGEWNDKPCDEALNAVCADVTGLNVTFVFIEPMMSWTEAQRYCRDHHTDLASVRNMPENNMVKQLVPKNQSAWIGLFRDSWKWTDGRTSSFRYWARSEPNNIYWAETCVLANFKNSGKWEDWTCDWIKEFVCYSVPAYKQVVRIRLESNSDLDLDGSAVMEEMLKQLKQKLQDEGVNGDIKLSWRKRSDGKVFHKDMKTTKKNST